MGSQLPIGSEPVATVARFNLWTLEWNARGLGPFRRGYWNAPIFSPTRGAFAFSDPQPLTGAVFHVLTLLGIGATVAYALILLGALTLNGVAAARLLDGVGAGFVPASLGGALMVALPFVANEFGVLQLMMVFPMLFGLDALFRYFRHPDWQPAAIVGVWVAVSFLTSEYYAYFLLLALAIVTVVMLVRTKPRVAQLAHAAIAAGVALLLAGPFLAAQSSRIRGYAWPRDVVADLGANPRDWFRLHDSALGAHLPLVGTAHGAQLALYPGTILLVLAYFGLAGARRKQLRWIIAVIAVAVVASLLADGFGLDLFGWAPYQFLRDHLPGLSRIRSPYRFAVLTQVGVALLAGLGLDALWRWWHRWGAVLAIALTALAIIEVAQTPLRTEPAIPGPQRRLGLVPLPPTRRADRDDPVPRGPELDRLRRHDDRDAPRASSTVTRSSTATPASSPSATSTCARTWPISRARRRSRSSEICTCATSSSTTTGSPTRARPRCSNSASRAGPRSPAKTVPCSPSRRRDKSRKAERERG